MKATLDTIIYFVQNVDLLKNFYTNAFAMTCIENSPGWVLLDSGHAKLGLHKIGEGYTSNDHIGNESNCKIVFDIHGDIQEMRNLLILLNATMNDVKTYEGYEFWLCDGKDPEGNVFQIRQKR